jgi:hypothetical protein
LFRFEIRAENERFAYYPREGMEKAGSAEFGLDARLGVDP